MFLQDNDLQTQVRYIRQQLRTMMNGVASMSQRDKGLTYKWNFGVELPRLQDFSESLPHSYELAAALWKEENTRELRLLASMLMPHDAFAEDLAELWVEQMRFTEEAEVATLHLFQFLPFASQKVFEWLARPEVLHRYTAYMLLSRLFLQGKRLSDRDAAELLDNIAADLCQDDLSLRNAAYRTLLRYMDQGESEEAAGEAVLARFEAR